MLSKLLTFTALSSGFATPDIVQGIHKNWSCALADMKPDEAVDAFYQLRNSVNEQTDYNVRDFERLAVIDGDALVKSAKDECAKLKDLEKPKCDDLGADAMPGECQKQLNDGTITPILGGYGCWGTFPTQAELNAEGASSYYRLVAHARGKPKDKLDGYIRDLVQAYKCIMEENIAQGEGPCTPWEETFTHAYQPVASGPTITTWTLSCITNGANSCNKKACLVETLFAARFSLWTHEQMNSVGGSQMPNDDTTYFHATAAYNDNNDFDGVNAQFVNTDAACPTTGTVIHVYCCGEYPYRNRVHSATNTDQCCKGVVYNTSTDTCCGDPENMGSTGTLLALPGTCPP